jgi:nucleosome binding factor SPN SPT16 subunit
VQFYREATDIQFDETGNRKRKYRYGDEDEFEQEQEERKRKMELDKLFQSFAQKIAEAGKSEGIEVDVPVRELGFHGVPYRSNVFIQPTTDCLIQVVEPPFMVITLEDIEVAHLERVQFGLKNFDMVFVFKDYNRTPYHINTIPMEQIDDVKAWLDDSEILYSDGPLNLNWQTIMKTVTSDPHQFFQDNGWAFLQNDSDDDAGEEEEEDEDSAFEIDDDELVEASESSEEGSDYGSNVSDEDEEMDDASDDDGEDWDELEKKAARKDRETGPDEDETRGKKRKR